MKKRKVLEMINIDSIIDLLNYIEYDRNFDDIREDHVKIGEEEYSIYKIGDNLSISSSNKPLLFLSNKDVNPNSFIDNGERKIRIMFKLDSNDFAGFEGNIKYEDCSIDREKLIDSLKPTYYRTSKNDSITFDNEMMPKGLKECDDGVLYHGILLTDDGKEILKINNEIVPRKSQLHRFNLKKEKEILKKLYDVSNLNGITKLTFKDSLPNLDKEQIDQMMSKLDKNSRYLDKCLKFYERVTSKISNLLLYRKKYLEGIHSSIYNERELSRIRQWLNNRSNDNIKLLEKQI